MVDEKSNQRGRQMTKDQQESWISKEDAVAVDG